ncbi:MAG TPA: hypothetical protein VFW31_06060 [Candidatus Angelobacter sp.]|nr:hypothetical protein [Candidatus Angelobacter sp.]
MTYRKPEITALGEAASTIQNGAKVPPFSIIEFTGRVGVLQPAYDLDE